jgi:hypothetical protein
MKTITILMKNNYLRFKIYNQQSNLLFEKNKKNLFHLFLHNSLKIL